MKKKLPYILIIVSVILLTINISRLDFENLKDGTYAGIISNILLIAAMILVVIDKKKRDKKI